MTPKIVHFNLRDLINLYAIRLEPAISAKELAEVFNTKAIYIVKNTLKNRTAFLYDSDTFPKASGLVKNPDDPEHAVLTVQGMLIYLELEKIDSLEKYLSGAMRLSAIFADAETEPDASPSVPAKPGFTAHTLANFLLYDAKTTPRKQQKGVKLDW